MRMGAMKLTTVNYAELSSRQQEAYNFQKVSGVLADFGFVRTGHAGDGPYLRHS